MPLGGVRSTQGTNENEMRQYSSGLGDWGRLICVILCFSDATWNTTQPTVHETLIYPRITLKDASGGPMELRIAIYAPNNS